MPFPFALSRKLLPILAAYVLLASAGHTLAESYKLDTGDIVHIQLLEKKEVSGDYPVGIDGAVSLPGLGVVTARGETIRSLEEKLRVLVANLIIDPSIAAHIIQYRPFFVLGDVFEPGKYPYISDLTVVQAVALAKGFRRKSGAGDKFAQRLANLRARQALENHIVALASARLRLARVMAENEKVTTFDFQPSDIKEASLRDLNGMIEDERSLLKKRNEAFEKELAQEQSTLAARELEAASYNERIASQNQLISQVNRELKSISKLKKQGLVSNDRVNTLIRAEIGARGGVLHTKSLLRQAEVSVNETKKALLALTLGREVEIAQSIRDLKDQIRGLEALIEGELAILDSTDDGHLRSADPESLGYRFELLRGGQLLNTEVRFDSKIKPGDTLIVLFKSSRIDDMRLSNSIKSGE